MANFFEVEKLSKMWWDDDSARAAEAMRNHCTMHLGPLLADLGTSGIWKLDEYVRSAYLEAMVVDFDIEKDGKCH